MVSARSLHFCSCCLPGNFPDRIPEDGHTEVNLFGRDRKRRAKADTIIAASQEQETLGEGLTHNGISPIRRALF